MSKNQKNIGIGTVAVATLIGGVLGSFVGLMFAPKSGKEMRQDIQTTVEGIIEQVEDTAFQCLETLKQRSDDLAEKGEKLKADIQLFIQDLTHQKSASIETTQSASEEISPAPETEIESPEFVPTEIPTCSETPSVYL